MPTTFQQLGPFFISEGLGFRVESRHEMISHRVYVWFYKVFRGVVGLNFQGFM